jgi:hypothetical protein
MISTRLLPALAVAALAGPAVAQDIQYELINQTGIAVLEFYTSPVAEEMWGYDLLAATDLLPGESGVVTIADGSDQCAYDLLFVMEDGQEIYDTVNICDLASYTLIEE